MLVEALTSPLHLAEGPHWHEPDQALYFVTLFKSRINKYVPSLKKHTSAVVGKENVPVTAIFPIEGKANKFVICYGRDLAVIEWDGMSESVADVELIKNVEPSVENRLNDAKVAPNGSLILGTMGPKISKGVFKEKVGALYAFKDGEMKKILKDTSISNGLAWSMDGTTFYFVDSLKYTVDAFDYDLNTNIITNRRVIFDFKEHNLSGIPDGMTIDIDGNLWVANYADVEDDVWKQTYNGGKVLQIDPREKCLLRVIEIPSPQVTSMAFGGIHMDELYVTSAVLELPQHIIQKYPDSGSLFVIKDTEAKGNPGLPVSL